MHQAVTLLDLYSEMRGSISVGATTTLQLSNIFPSLQENAEGYHNLCNDHHL
jgi:hypothetical protein